MKPDSRFQLIKPSTRSFIREAKSTKDYSLYDFLHGYFYARWLYLYIGFGTGEHPLGKMFKSIQRWYDKNFHFGNNNSKIVVEDHCEATNSSNSKTFAEGYHGKVVPLESAKRLVTVGEDIDLPNLEHIVPYQRARDIILRNPDHIVVMDCPCRASRPNPCLPLDVCLVIGEPFAGFVIEHHPERARWINPDEAVQILEDENERGHVHHAFFKDAMLGRFYAICNCCSCCCGAMQSQRNGTPMLASSGYISQVDDELCIGCGDCTEFCQFGALTLVGYTASVDQSACMGCGVCVDKCIQGALSLKRDASKGEPLEICELMEHVSLDA